MQTISRKAVVIALIEHDLLQWELAAKLRIPPDRLSRILRGHLPADEAFRRRLERVLHLAPGTVDLQPATAPQTGK